MERILYADPVLPQHATTTKAAVEAAEIHTEKIAGVNGPDILTTITDPSSWRLDTHSQRRTMIEAIDARMIDVTVEIASSGAIATKGKNGANVATQNPSGRSRKRWTTGADSTSSRGTTENYAPITP
jgi:hypothetical protein